MPWYPIERVPQPHPDRPGALVFGSFNQYVKISDACLDSWCRILMQLPDAELLVLDVRSEAMREDLLKRISRRGIDAERLKIRGRVEIFEYFNSIGNVDIALDTFPYNGATTTLDTLWMGTPLAALRGERGISRGCYSILKTLGADELIALNPDEYVDINVRLARDADWRTRLRDTLRPRLVASPLMDAKQFVADLEERYRQMWRAWCASGTTTRSPPSA